MYLLYLRNIPHNQDKYYLRIKENKIQGNRPTKQAGIAVLLPDKIRFKLVRRDKECYFKLIKENRPSRGYYNSKHVCAKHEPTQFYITNTIRYKVTD